ncbi:MAG: carbohydrate ABC transporter permease, partial [Clostridiales bacterium]|nr:carbohydrate ABC transporter permease [Clostridiales bacterium]
MKKTRADWAGQAAVVTLLLLFSLTVLYPMLYVLSVSLSNSSYVMRGEITFYPKGITLRAYEYMVQY